MPGSTVDLYVLGKPRPVQELALNFHPVTMTRWEARPSMRAVNFAVAVGADGREPGDPAPDSPVSESANAALHRAGITCLRGVYEAGKEGLRAVPGVGKKAYDGLVKWAAEHDNLGQLLAELKAEEEDAALSRDDEAPEGAGDPVPEDPAEAEAGEQQEPPPAPGDPLVIDQRSVVIGVTGDRKGGE